MKKIVFVLAMMLLCFQTTMAVDLKYNQEFHETIFELGFEIDADNDAYISWELLGDWDKFNYEFSQGTLKGGVLTIRSSEYKDFVDKYEGVALFIKGKSKTRTGNYVLTMKVKEVSEDVGFSPSEFDMDIPIEYTGKPMWLLLLTPCIILIVLVLLIILLLHVTAKFPRGLLQLGQDSVKLKGKKRISVKEELEKMNVTLAEGTDVILVKKRFGSFQGPCVKEMRKCDLECDGSYLTPGSIIHLQEEIKGLKDINGNDIIICYV